jgi:hypothetical protein
LETVVHRRGDTVAKFQTMVVDLNVVMIVVTSANL